MKNTSFTVVLDRTAHHWAKTFAGQQTTVGKGRRVYLNTLAVCAVQQYIKIVCQLQLVPGDAWHPSHQAILDVADLVVPGLGKIECRSILPGEHEMNVPLESIDDRIGYVAVQFNEELSEVELLGCTQHLSSGSILLDQLSPIESLIDWVMTNSYMASLEGILTGVFGNGWEPVSSLITDTIKSDNRDLALRSVMTSLIQAPFESIHNFTAGKMMDLKVRIGSISLLLLVGLSREPDGRIKVRVRLYSAGTELQLPPNIQLVLQDGRGQIKSQVQYPQSMNFIQLNYFRLESGTKFNIQIALDNHSVMESFVA
jgi:Protein of unknown function (DUF1822)